MRFDVASVKPNVSGDLDTWFRTPPGRLMVHSADVRILIKNAYGIRQDVDLIGGPRWIETERFDIEATAPDGADYEQVLLKLQTLLAERFQLAVHRETRQAQVYKLVVASGGPKVRELKPGMKPRSPDPDARVISVFGKMTGLARVLSRLLGREVIDATGLTGSYDLSIEIARDEAPAPPGSDGEIERTSPAGPSIFSALEEQLGLKLLSAKAPVSVLVIDKVERPSAN